KLVSRTEARKAPWGGKSRAHRAIAKDEPSIGFPSSAREYVCPGSRGAHVFADARQSGNSSAPGRPSTALATTPFGPTRERVPAPESTDTRTRARFAGALEPERGETSATRARGAATE